MQICNHNLLDIFPMESSCFYISYVFFFCSLFNFIPSYWILRCVVECRFPPSPNTMSCNVTKSEMQFLRSVLWPGSSRKFYGFYLGPCYTLPPSFIEIGLAWFLQSCLQATNHTENITSLLEFKKKKMTYLLPEHTTLWQMWVVSPAPLF